MPRNHTGLGTILIEGEAVGLVDFDISREDERGWQIVRGTIKGDPSVLAAAAEHGQPSLRHEASGFVMKLLVADMKSADVANVTVDVSKDH